MAGLPGPRTQVIWDPEMLVSLSPLETPSAYLAPFLTPSLPKPHSLGEAKASRHAILWDAGGWGRGICWSFHICKGLEREKTVSCEIISI